MATSFLTVTTSAPRLPLDRPFPLPTLPRHALKLVPKATSALPVQASAFNLQNLLDKFMPGKSRREYLANESIYAQGDSANTVFYIQKGSVKLTVVSSSGKAAVIRQAASLEKAPLQARRNKAPQPPHFRPLRSFGSKEGP